MTERGKSVVLVVAALGLALLICEFGLRLWQGVPPLDFPNFRDRDPFRVRETVRYDAELGWVSKENFNRADLHTVALGIRRNSAMQNGPRPGHVLAIGASITAGFALTDEASWPAQLETLLGQPVDNAGVLGYGFDQTVLRAEQLLPVERPRLLLLGIGTANIEWMQSTVMLGAAKPFFSIDVDVLRVHNVPVPRREPSPLERIMDALGYSAVVDFAMSRLAGNAWYPPPLVRDRNGSADPVNVSCALMQRLKHDLDERHVDAAFVIEPQWHEIVFAQAPTAELDRVLQCAREAGLQVIDTLAAMRSDYLTDPRHAASYWEPGRGHRHLTEAGSRRLAELVAGALELKPRQSQAR